MVLDHVAHRSGHPPLVCRSVHIVVWAEHGEVAGLQLFQHDVHGLIRFQALAGLSQRAPAAKGVKTKPGIRRWVMILAPGVLRCWRGSASYRDPPLPRPL